ncbi:hypothetical protein [Hoeflea sp. EC-HK425]|uniref:hypothetical protein n=1 Tax=Hoeflea sp. EC-HK425 TaxID=2038388 RepID=UPI00125B33CC|nr:hypothetical protein [Hoeflea sp. EC-HK425]VVT15334.1 conserved hypothetical protein [Hoeflea sp. EC-HK425]
MEIASEIKSTLARHLVVAADAYCAATGESRNAISKRLLHRGGQLNALAAGQRDVRGETAETAMKWLSDNWPEGAEWPAEVERPRTSEERAVEAAPAIPEAAE